MTASVAGITALSGVIVGQADQVHGVGQHRGPLAHTTGVRRAGKRNLGGRESAFSFFNRCGAPAITAVRVLLEDSVARYPSAGPDPTARAELISRFRSKDDTEFRSAFWELYLHESLTRAGYELAPHPETENGRRPDFLATKGSDRLYVEAARSRAPG